MSLFSNSLSTDFTMNSITQIKLVLLGDESVGKTSLLQKWIQGSFDTTISPTVGGATSSRQDQVNGVKYSFQIWDTAGAERYRALTPLYSRDAGAAMIVFDLTRKSSIENVKSWINVLQQHGSIPFILVGNKEDLSDKAVISHEDATDLAFSVQSQYFPTSAKLGSGVDLAFRQLEVTAVEYFLKSGTGGTETLNVLGVPDAPKKTTCC